MNIAAKILSVFMTAVLAFGMSGCTAPGKAGRSVINELQSHKGDLLVIVSHPQEAMPAEEYDKAVVRMSVTYDGCAINPNPINNAKVKMPDDEYLRIYNFCVEAAAENRFAGYSEDICDGTTYTFTYYDTEGNAHVLYDGYCYDNKELQDIMKLISKYSLD